MPVTLQVQEKLKYNQVVNMSKAKAKHELLPVCSNNLAQEREIPFLLLQQPSPPYRKSIHTRNKENMPLIFLLMLLIPV